MKIFKDLKQPANKDPVERIMEDYVRSAYSDLSNERQTEIYNDIMYDFYNCIRSRLSRGQQPMRVSEGNKVWRNYRDRYVDPKYRKEFEKSCRGGIEKYREEPIPSGFGRNRKNDKPENND